MSLGISSKYADLDEAMEVGAVDDWGCHKKCGEYFDNCTCEV